MQMKDKSYLSFSLCILLLRSNREYIIEFFMPTITAVKISAVNVYLFYISDKMLALTIFVLNNRINYCNYVLQNNSCAAYLNITNHDLISYVNLSLFLQFLLPLQPQHQNLVLVVVQKFFLAAA